MNLLESDLQALWLALGWAVFLLCFFVCVDLTVLPGKPKGSWLLAVGAMSSMAVFLAEVTFLTSIAGSSLDALWVVFFLTPLTLLAGVALWLACIPAVGSKDLESALSWWKTGVGLTFVIWCLGAGLSGFGFAIDAGVILLISVAMARRACTAPFASKLRTGSEVMFTRRSFK